MRASRIHALLDLAQSECSPSDELHIKLLRLSFEHVLTQPENRQMSAQFTSHLATTELQSNLAASHLQSILVELMPAAML